MKAFAPVCKLVTAMFLLVTTSQIFGQCNLASQGYSSIPSPLCTTYQVLGVNPGSYFDLNTVAGTYYDFVYSANGCTNVSGMCITALNGTGYTGNFSNISGIGGWYSGTCTAVQLSSFKTAAANGCSSVLEYRYTTPANPAFTADPTAVCVNTSATYAVSPVAGATSYVWTVSGGGGTILSGQGTTSIVVNFSTQTLSSAQVSVHATNNGFCNSATISTPLITVDGVRITESAAAVCSGVNDTLNGVTVGGSGTQTFQWQSSPNGTTWTNVGPNNLQYIVAPSSTTYYRLVYTNTAGLACASVTSNVDTVTVVSQPSIATQPNSPSICQGTSGNVSLVVSGGVNLTYQWQYNNGTSYVPVTNGTPFGITYTNPTSATMTIAANTSTTSAAYFYRCVVTSAGGCSSATSATSTVSIQATPVITSQTTVDTICDGTTGALTINATGSGTLTYQWQYYNGSVLANITNGTPAGVTYSLSPTGSTLSVSTTNGTTPLGSYPYYCIVNSNYGCVPLTSSAATLTVASATAITAQTLADTICNGSSAAFSVTATGRGTLSYQWQYYNGSSFVNVANGTPAGVSYTNPTTSSLGIATTLTSTPPGSYQYHCVISSSVGCNPLSSTTAVLNVGSQHGSGSVPATNYVCIGSSENLTATPAGSGSFGYQWQYYNGSAYVNVVNGIPAGVTYTNANTATITIATTGSTPVGSQNYQCVITAAAPCASTTTNVATVNFTAQPTITGQTLVDTLCAGSAGTISVTASGGTALAYQWQYFNGVSYSNVVNGTPAGVTYTNPTSATLTIGSTNGTTPSGNYRYQCVVTSTGACNTATSSGTAVTIGPAAPAAPGLAAPTNIGCNSFTANWQAATNATGYYLDVAYDGGFTDFLPGWDATFVGNVTSANITGLTAWLPYYYRVRAADHCTGTVSATDTVFTLPATPNAPSDNSYYNFEYTAVPSPNLQQAFTIYGSGNPSFLEDFSVVSGTPNIYASGDLTGINAFQGNQYAITGVCNVAPNWSEGVQIMHNFNAGSTYNVTMAIRNVPYAPATSPNPIDIQFALLQGPLASTFIPGDGCSPTPTLPGTAAVPYTLTDFATNAWTVVTFPITGLTANYTELWMREQFSAGDPLQTTLLCFDSIVITQTSGNNQVGTNITCSSFTANWNTTENATGYYLDVSSSPTFSTFLSGWNNTNVGNATSASITGLTAGTTYYYRVRAVGSCGTSASSATVAVPLASVPVITSQPPATVNVCRGDSAYTTITATGQPSVTYQWQFDNGGTWANVTNNTPAGITYFSGNSALMVYRTTVSTTPGNYQYRCIVSSVSGCASDTSTITNLNVNSVPVITTCPGSQTLNTDPSVCDATVNYPPAIVTGNPAPTVTYSKNSGTVFALGTTTVTVTATNSCGTATCSFEVTVVDHQPPSIMCPGSQTLPLNDSCTAVLPDYTSLAITSDNCSHSGGSGSNSIRVTQSPAAGTGVSGAGNTTVTLTATDSSGNSNSCSFNVHVADTIPPTAICKNVTVYLNDEGNATITAAQINNGSYDNCGVASVTVSPDSFTCSNLGANTVVLRVTDVNGNVSTCTSTVTVSDTTRPVANCHDITVQLDGNGMVNITPAQVNNGSYDNCDIQTLSIYPYSFNCSNVGANTVQLTVTDVSGNSATCTSTVTVGDNIAPVAICRDVTVTLNADGNATVTAAQVNNGSYDNCSIASVSVSPDSFTCANVGPNNVTLTVTDVNGNVSSCTSTVTVQDNVPPTAICRDVTVQLDSTGNASVTAAQVNNGSYDNCGIASVTVSPNTFTCSNTGANSVTLTVTDVNGNVSTCTSTVTVQDNIAPTAICQNVTVQLDAGGHASVTAAQVNNGSYDNCSIASITVSPDSFTCGNVGPNTVTLTVTDASGNVSTCNSTVTVQDNIAPTAICQPYTVQLDASGNASITTAQINNGSYDNCGIASMTVSPNTFTCFNVGPNTVTLTVTDVNGNVSSCSSTVTVQDNIAPAAICKNVTVYLDASGNTGVSADEVNNGSYDNCGIASVSVSPNTFNCSDVGPNDVTLTVTDVNGNVSTCTSTVTVADTVAPVAICKNVTLQLDATGNATLTTSQLNDGSYDNCGTASITVSPTTFNCSNVGANTATLTVTDVNGNVSTCSSIVTVQDTTPPVANCKPVTVQLDSTGNASVTAAQVNNGSYDNCGIASVTVSPNTFTCSNVGANTVTLTVTDVNGNVSTCTSTVTVQDNIAPVAICQNVTVQLDASGHASVTAAQVNNGSYDNCGIASVTVSPNTFTCSNVGANTVTLTVTDVNGNVSTCTSTVTVQDNIAPTAICQNVTVQLDASGHASVTAAQVNNGSYDNCGIASVTVSPNAFTCSNVGANTVTLTVSDVNGNVSTCTSTVTVQDNIAPTAICQNVTVQLDASGHASVTAAQVNNGSYDNCGIASVTVSPNTFTCSNVGANTVTLTVTDVNGNVSTCTSTVTVQDNIAPTAICQNVTVQLDASGHASVTAAQVNNGSYDNCGIASVTVSPNAFTCSNVGANTVTLTVTDVNGNVSTCTSTVTVQDNIAPVAICQNVTVQLDASGHASVTAAQVNNGSYDNCGIASVTVSPNTFTCSNVGANTVTLTVTDVNGNVSTCTSTVTVQDNIAPTAICQNVTVQLDVSGHASVTAAQVNNGSYDNCGIASVTVSPNTFTCSNVGSNIVTLTVTDVNGNVSTCTSIVTVQDNIAPVAICQNVIVQLDASGHASVTAAQVNNGSHDNCGIASVTVSPSTFSCGNVGANTVTLTVTDLSGNVSTCTSIVTVQDHVVPNAVCKPVTVYLNSSGNASVTAAQVDNGSTDACGIASRSVSPNTFTCSNTGSNTVTLSVTDVNGNTGTCTTTVTVLDTIKPTAICKNASVTLGSGGTVSITASQINNGSYDNCGIASVTVSPSTFNCSDIGSNIVTLTVTDLSGNVSTCQSTVTVSGELPSCSVSATPSSLDILGSIGIGEITGTIFLGIGPQRYNLTSTVSGGSSYTYSWSGGNLSCYTCADPVFEPTAAGNYTLTLTVTNNYGCSSTCSVTICVIDARDGITANVYLCNPATETTVSVNIALVALYLILNPDDQIGACGSICSGERSLDIRTSPAAGTNKSGEFDVQVYPNPFASDFRLNVQSSSSDDIRVRIYDVAGKLIDEKANIAFGAEIHLGQTLADGIYMVEVRQGESAKVLRVVKTE